MAQRLRQAVKQGAQLNLINPVDDDLLCKVANRAIVGPAAMAQMLAQVVKAAAESKGTEIPGGARRGTERCAGDRYCAGHRRKSHQ